MNEALEVIEKWLKGDTYGVNALLTNPGFPLRDEEIPPTDIQIYSEVSNEECALGKDPPQLPALMIVSDGAEDEDLKVNMPGKQEVTVSGTGIGIAWVERDVPILEAIRRGNTVLRAVRMSLRRYNLFARDDADKEINSVRVLDVTSISTQNVAGYVGQTLVTGFVRTTVRYQDRVP